MGESFNVAIIPEIAPVFKRFIKVLEQFTEGCEPIRAHIPQEDQELAQLWQDSLRESLREDIQKVFEHAQLNVLGEQVVYWDEAVVESVLRVCAAVRLNIHQERLNGISDEALEEGTIDYAALPETQQQALSLYVFLAAVQEWLIDHCLGDADSTI